MIKPEWQEWAAEALMRAQQTGMGDSFSWRDHPWATTSDGEWNLHVRVSANPRSRFQVWAIHGQDDDFEPVLIDSVPIKRRGGEA